MSRLLELCCLAGSGVWCLTVLAILWGGAFLRILHGWLLLAWMLSPYLLFGGISTLMRARTGAKFDLAGCLTAVAMFAGAVGAYAFMLSTRAENAILLLIWTPLCLFLGPVLYLVWIGVHKHLRPGEVRL